MKKVAFFTPSLNIGGIERVFITYANYLINDYVVDYVICHNSSELGAGLSNKVNFISLNSQLRFSLLKLTKYIARNKPDYLITGGDISNAVVIIANKLSFTKTKVIISQHNYLNSDTPRSLSKFIYKIIYKYSYKIISVSSGITEFLVNFNIPQNQIVTLYNPIDTNTICSLSKESINPFINDYILYLGRLSEVKNLNFLIRSYSIFRKYCPTIKLVLIGDGLMKKPLEDLVLSLGLEDSVVFLGIQLNPYPYIRHASFIVLPSLSEALPTVILESFILNKVIVATPTKGALDLLKDGEYGYLSNSFDNEQEFSTLMLNALRNPIDSNKLNGYALKFDISFKINEIKNLLK